MVAAIDLKLNRPQVLTVNRKFVLDDGFTTSIEKEEIQVVEVSGLGLHEREDGLFDLYHLSSSNRVLKRMGKDQAFDLAKFVLDFTWEHLCKVQAGIDDAFASIQGMRVEPYIEGLWQVIDDEPMSIPTVGGGEIRVQRNRNGISSKERALIVRSQQVYSFYPENCIDPSDVF